MANGLGLRLFDIYLNRAVEQLFRNLLQCVVIKYLRIFIYYCPDCI